MFSDLLLTTKLRVPAISQVFIPRLRLTEQLTEGLNHKVTLVIAPAGFGKTTLLCEWLQADTAKIPLLAWVSLDESDNHLHVFWSYILTALEQCETGLGQPALRILQTQQTTTIDAVLRILLNTLTEKSTNYVLVLDDYHVITDPMILESLIFFITHKPPQMRVVIASRSEPAFPLSRWRGRNQLQELRLEQLRCTPQEVQAFLEQRMKCTLNQSQVQACVERSEGWITGLQFLSLALPYPANPLQLLDALQHNQRYILDYLTDEVLRKQPEDIQMFLLRSSVLTQLSPSLCDEVLQLVDSQSYLDGLKQHNLFIERVHGYQLWYRYSTLFAEALRHRLEQTFPQEEIRLLHQRAAHWYRCQGYTQEALHHAHMAQHEHSISEVIPPPIAQPSSHHRFSLETVPQQIRCLPPHTEQLTKREREVLLLVARGATNQEIADDLLLTVPTIKGHLSNIYGKLQVRNRVQALKKARQLGHQL